MSANISLSFVLVALAISVGWTGLLVVVMAIGNLTMRFDISWYAIFWSFVGIFLGILLGLCINYNSGVR